MKRDAVHGDVPDASNPVHRERIGRLGLTIAILFGILYVYDLFEAVSNLIGVAAQLNGYNDAASRQGFNTLPIPWGLLLANLLLPPVAYGTAFFLGRRRPLGVRALIFLGGLGVVAALTLSLSAFV